MKVNQFTQKLINNSLPKEIRQIDFIEEEVSEDPIDLYYHSKLIYKGTIVYCESAREYKGPDTTKEEIISDISDQINKFDKILENDSEEECLAFIMNTIRIRYYEEEFKNKEGKKVEYYQWSDRLENYISSTIYERELANDTLLEAYDKCIRNFKKEVVEETKA